MVCDRCIMVVSNIFNDLGYAPVSTTLGSVETQVALNDIDLQKLRQTLESYGFELINDAKSRIIEQIKNIIVNAIHHSNEELKVTYSEYISSQLNKDYSSLSNLFSEIEGTTIEKYIIHQKIEKAKELLAYNELTLSEIAFQMGYKNVAYLSSQFKKITGMTPSQFKQTKKLRRKPLDQV